MKNTIYFLLGLFTGGVVGGFAAYKHSEKKFSHRLDSEMDAIKNLYCKNSSDKKSFYEDDSEAVDKNVDAVSEEKEAGDMQNYQNYASYYKGETEKEEEVEFVEPEKDIPTVDKPYVITPDDFGSMGYDELYLTFYSDGVLTEDGDGEKLPIKKTIGKGNIKRLGEYANDTLYIRDEKRKIDYEIVRVEQTYDEVYGDDSEDEEE